MGSKIKEMDENISKLMTIHQFDEPRAAIYKGERAQVTVVKIKTNLAKVS